MTRLAKLVETIGLAMVLGSILGFVVMNMVVGDGQDLGFIHHQRMFVSAISSAVTIPGVWVLAIGTGVGLLDANLRDRRWALFRLAIACLIVANTTLLMAPLISRVSGLAAVAAANGRPDPAYPALKAREDGLGALNFLLLIPMLALSVRTGSATRPATRERRSTNLDQSTD